ncbi:MAG: hypothetical protein KDD84_23605 [Caldilineaceae bacterium]|nr:hypothetical protein [Caldilineaceae bacterium]
MFTLTDVLIDAIWILGLSGVFATFSYIDYYRHLQQWRWRDAWQRPVLLTPLSLSLAVFTLGLTLNGVTSRPPAALWETAIWAVMFLLFAWQTVMYTLAGRRQGWTAPLDGVDGKQDKPAQQNTESPKEPIGVEPNQ